MTELDDIFDEQEEVPAALETDGEPYSKEDWIKQKAENRKQVFELLETATTALTDPERFAQYLDVQSRFDRYSVSNVLLISAQKPDAIRIADAKTWQQSGAYIKKGEKALTILEPGKVFVRQDGTKSISYDAKKVFDITQTTAELLEHRTKQVDDRKLIRALMKASPVPVCISNELPDGVNAAYVPQQKEILVRQGMNGADIFWAIANEIAHARMEQSDAAQEDNKFAADCVSYLLCKRNGIEPKRVGDVKALDGKEPKERRDILKVIRDEANDITAVMEKALANRDRDAR